MATRPRVTRTSTSRHVATVAAPPSRERDDVEVDFVAGIPDSGIGHAIGYAAEANLPYRRPFVKYTPTWPRSFMPQEQRVRDLVAKMKLIPMEELIEGNRLLFCEDSIVRGTQLRDIIKRLFDRGALEVHMRPACPPLLHSCKFLNFSQSKSELDLAGRRAIVDLEGNGDARLDEYGDPDSDLHTAMVDRIGERLELTSLRYQRLDDMIEAIGLPRERLCTYCWSIHAKLPRMSTLANSEKIPERHLMNRAIITLFVVLAGAVPTTAGPVATVSSPDGKVEITFRTRGRGTAPLLGLLWWDGDRRRLRPGFDPEERGAPGRRVQGPRPSARESRRALHPCRRPGKRGSGSLRGV